MKIGNLDQGASKNRIEEINSPEAFIFQMEDARSPLTGVKNLCKASGMVLAQFKDLMKPEDGEADWAVSFTEYLNRKGLRLSLGLVGDRQFKPIIASYDEVMVLINKLRNSKDYQADISRDLNEIATKIDNLTEAFNGIGNK